MCMCVIETYVCMCVFLYMLVTELVFNLNCVNLLPTVFVSKELSEKQALDFVRKVESI